MINIYQGIPVSGSTVSASHCYLLFIQLRRQGWNCARFEGEEHKTATPRWQSQDLNPGRWASTPTTVCSEGFLRAFPASNSGIEINAIFPSILPFPSFLPRSI